ncbi:hypothetical protein BESB_067490 [Besnoitia besnoiti]|uniref:Uncharacterized protein n=1 Tax=Besnoitia besnoiti TaxID=94643 RepID=A0A2A9MFH7_BESBE|nr:hypothetical protein BESB_067490 [Besnoitia besnoiti]PFH34716.1 hypothetical protein BESB_067490 [Besnoitia besnoiti]
MALARLVLESSWIVAFVYYRPLQSVVGQTIGAAAEFQDPRVAAQLQEQYKPRTRNLKPYYGPEELNKAFCTKFQVVDKASGRTDIMTARRPGSANAVVNLSAFDAYSMRTPKLSSALKQISSIENSPLGLMPRPGAESSEKTARPSAGACMNRSQLHCKDSWLAPDENASTRRHLGESKRHVALFWAQRPTGTILQHVSSPKRPLPSRYTVARQLHSVASDLRPDHPPVHEAHRKREHVSMDSTQLEEDQNHRLPPPCVDFENPSDFHQRQRETKIHEYSQQLKSYDNARRAAIEVERQQLADEERYYQAQLQHYERERQRQEAQDKAMERLQQEYYKGPFEKKSVPEYPFKRDPQH